jgi:hypothetical protein
MCDLIIIRCRSCGSEGRIYRQGIASRWALEPVEIDEGQCPDCDGTGGEMIEGEPITLDDLIELAEMEST